MALLLRWQALPLCLRYASSAIGTHPTYVKCLLLAHCLWVVLARMPSATMMRLTRTTSSCFKSVPFSNIATSCIMPTLVRPAAAAGATSAVLTTPLLAPGERVKCLLQTQVRRA